MGEFIERGLDRVYTKEIAEWQKYYREQRFAKKLSKEMEREIERFQKELKKWKKNELEEFIIKGLDCLK